LLHGSVFAVVLLSATTGWAETWTLARYPEYRFQAEFPGPVKEFPMTLNENTQKLIDRSHRYSYSTTSGDASFGVSAVHALPTVTMKREAIANGNLANECQTIEKRSIGDDIEWIGTDCKAGYRHLLRVIIKDNWVYQVYVLSRPADDQSAARHFVESFKFIEN
jgi:hypothetical protein